jgi:predicted RNA-binding Zn-ribbon protein involved in translation (DUF1610 family)
MASKKFTVKINPKEDPEYAAVICPNCGRVKISYKEYMKQLTAADSLWKCPNCIRPARFDQRYYEEHNYPRSGSWKNQATRNKIRKALE